jgi:integrase
MSSAWIYQDDKQVKKHGPEAASWYVGWIDPEGKRRCKSCGPGGAGQRNAEKLRRKVEAQLLTGTYQGESRAAWSDFRKEWEAKVGAGQAPRTRALTREALDHFERLVRPTKTYFVTTRHIDHYVAKRRQEPGRHVGDLVSPATVNKELRHLHAVLRVGQEWGYLPAVPRFRMLREPGRLPSYVTPEHFAALYHACDLARVPRGLAHCTAAAWWRGLLVLGYLTGWRLGDMLCLRRDRLDLEAGVAELRAEDTKARREERVPLHPVVVEHLRKLAGFTPLVFDFAQTERTLYNEFARLQEAAGIHLACDAEHRHTRFCHVYGFHDLRRAFATLNADRLTPDALQALMRHKDYKTTMRYINMARQLDAAVAGLHVPEVLRQARPG